MILYILLFIFPVLCQQDWISGGGATGTAIYILVVVGSAILALCTPPLLCLLGTPVNGPACLFCCYTGCSMSEEDKTKTREQDHYDSDGNYTGSSTYTYRGRNTICCIIVTVILVIYLLVIYTVIIVVGAATLGVGLVPPIGLWVTGVSLGSSCICCLWLASCGFIFGDCCSKCRDSETMKATSRPSTFYELMNDKNAPMKIPEPDGVAERDSEDMSSGDDEEPKIQQPPPHPQLNYTPEFIPSSTSMTRIQAQHNQQQTSLGYNPPNLVMNNQLPQNMGMMMPIMNAQQHQLMQMQNGMMTTQTQPNQFQPSMNPNFMQQPVVTSEVPDENPMEHVWDNFEKQE